MQQTNSEYVKGLENKKTRYLKLLQTVEEIKYVDGIDHVKIDADKQKVLQLQAELSILDNRYNYINIDLKKEISNLISDLTNGTISNQELSNRLVNIKEMYSRMFETIDFEKTEDTIEQISKMESEILMKKSALDKKLMDQSNYSPSAFELEFLSEEIATIQQQVEKYDSDISLLEASLLRYETEQQEIQSNITKLEAKKDDYYNQLSEVNLKSAFATDVASFDVVRKDIIDEIRQLDLQIEILYENKFNNDSLIISTNRKLKDLERSKKHEQRLLQLKSESFDRKNVIDQERLENDKKQSAVYAIVLANLTARKKAISFDYTSELDNIISKVVVEQPKVDLDDSVPKAVVEQPEIIIGDSASTTVVGQQKKELDDRLTTDSPKPTVSLSDSPDVLDEILSVLEETPIPEPEIVSDSKKTESTVELPEVPSDLVEVALKDSKQESQQEDENSKEFPDFSELVSSDEEQKKDNSKKIAIISKWKKASKSLIEKIKSSKFVKNMKKKLAVLLAVITIGSGIMTASTVRIGEKQESLPPTPTISTTLNTEDNPDKEIELPELEIEDETPEYEEKLSLEDIAWKVIRGEYGNGKDREKNLTDAGYDYQEVQDKVNELLGGMKGPSTSNGQDSSNISNPVTPPPVNPDSGVDEKYPVIYEEDHKKPDTEQDKDSETDIEQDKEPDIDHDIDIDDDKEPDTDIDDDKEPDIDDDKPEPEIEKVEQVVEPGQVGIFQSGDNNVSVTDNVQLSTGKETTHQQQLAQEIVDRLEQDGFEVGNYTDDPNLISSSVDDNGTITNTYEENTTSEKTVEDVVKELAEEAHDGVVTDWDGLNDIYLQEQEKGKSR